MLIVFKIILLMILLLFHKCIQCTLQRKMKVKILGVSVINGLWA